MIYYTNRDNIKLICNAATEQKYTKVMYNSCVHLVILQMHAAKYLYTVQKTTKKIFNK